MHVISASDLTKVRLPWVLLAALLVGSAGCGQVKEAAAATQDKATEAKDGTKQGAKALAERADDWANGDPIEDRQRFCAAEQGTWTESIVISPCVDGVVTLEFAGEMQQQSCEGGEGGTAQMQCLHRNEDGEVYFNDGPSVPNLMQSLTGLVADRADMQAYNRLFWPAGVSHDYCYHHGLAAEGASQRDCDTRYFSDLRAVCVHADGEGLDWFRPKMCRDIAAGHYMAVRSKGASSFLVLNSAVKTPPYEPLWQVYGLAEDALDEETLAEIDHRLAQSKVQAG